MILMADSVEPGYIPASFAAYANRGVAPYANGLYAWPHAQDRRFPRQIQGIDVNGRDPAGADVLDSERFDATPDHWPAWRHARVEAVKAGEATGWPKVYTSIAPGGGYGVKAIADATKAAGQIPVERWWIAWYVYPRIPTAADVCAEILRLTGVILNPAAIWACQVGTLGPTICPSSTATRNGSREAVRDVLVGLNGIRRRLTRKAPSSRSSGPSPIVA